MDLERGFDRFWRSSALCVLGALMLVGCEETVYSPHPIEVTSMAFSEGHTIPPRHTCKGEGTSVPLRFFNDIEGVREYAIIVEDLDAEGGSFVHWLLYGLGPELEFVTDGYESDEAEEGLASDGGQGYSPICPPEGEEHRYIFRVYALDSPSELPAGLDYAAVYSAIEGRVIGYGDLMGVYLVD